eukprot:gi/632935109/ref/XP_007887834.1/ PREDICTED: rootletin-like [Callorhinchus milii]
MSSLVSLREENRMLQEELSRMEDLLAQSHAERDELAIKQCAVSERLEKILKLEVSEREQEASETKTVSDVRRQFEDEERVYKRKLQAYQDGQQRQAQLVQKLQAKVLQYKKRCGELEQQILEKTSESEQFKLSLQTRLETTESRLRRTEHEHNTDLENALIRLEEEQQRSSSLTQVNAMLREQLDQANSANQRLSEDVHKVTTEYAKARDELEQREMKWRREQEAYSSHLCNEHSRLLVLWRQVAVIRSDFTELRSETERGLVEVKGTVSRTMRRMQTACLNLDSNLRLSQTSATSTLEKQTAQRVHVEQQLREKVKEMIQLQCKCDTEKAELHSRIDELSAAVERLRVQNAEKERNIAVLNHTLEKLESSKLESTSESSAAEGLRTDVETLYQALHNIAQVHYKPAFYLVLRSVLILKMGIECPFKIRMCNMINSSVFKM